MKSLSEAVVIMKSYIEILTLEFVFLHHISGLFGITRMLMLVRVLQKILDSNMYLKVKPLTILWCFQRVGKGCIGNERVNENVKIFSEILINILGNFVPHKLLKFNYKQPPWMNPKISSSLRKRVKLTKLFYKNPCNWLKELLMSKSNEYSNLNVTA